MPTGMDARGLSRWNMNIFNGLLIHLSLPEATVERVWSVHLPQGNRETSQQDTDSRSQRESKSHSCLKDTAGCVGFLCRLNYQSIHRRADVRRRISDPREGFRLTTFTSSTVLFPKFRALHTGTMPTSLRPVSRPFKTRLLFSRTSKQRQLRDRESAALSLESPHF